MDAISFDPNLIDCYLSGEGDYDFLISMFGNDMTRDEFDVLTEKIGAVLDNFLENVASLPEELFARTLQILHATRDTKLLFTWEQCQVIMVPFLSLCAALRTTYNLKMIYLTLNQLLQDATFRHVIITDQTLLPAISEMSKQLNTVGDYESQAVIFETMIRISHSDRRHWSSIWFPDEEFADMFVDIGRNNFEKTCRYFLNILNNTMEDQRVFSFIAQSVFIDDLEMKGPPECEFWIDFNYTSASISFYCVDHESLEEANDGNTSTTMWETVNLTSGLVSSCHLKMIPNSGSQEIIAYLKYPYFDNKFDSTPSKWQENKPFIKISFEICYEMSYHLEKVFKSLYKGRSIAMDNDTPDYALDNPSEEDALAPISNNTKSHHVIQESATYAMDSDDELHIDEQYPTSTPVSYAGQANFHDIPCPQLTPLTTMVPFQTDTNNVPDHNSFQNTLNGEDALTIPHVMCNQLVDSPSQRDHQKLGNVVSHGFNYAELQASIKQENSNSFDGSLDGNKSKEGFIFQTHIKKEITSSSELEVTTLNDSGIKTIYNIKKVSQSFMSVSPNVTDLAEITEENEEVVALPEPLTTANSVHETTGENGNCKSKKNSPLKKKIRQRKINPKLKVGKSLDTKTLNLNISDPTKRKRAAFSNKTISEIERSQNENDLDMPVVVNLSSLETKSSNKQADSGNKGKTTNKINITTKGSRKAQEVPYNDTQDTFLIQMNVADSEISHSKEITTQENRTVHRDTPLRKLARNVTTKTALRSKRQANSNLTSNTLPITRSAVSLHGRKQTESSTPSSPLLVAKSTMSLRGKNVDSNVPSSPLTLIKSTTSLYEECEVDNNVSHISPIANSTVSLRKKKQSNKTSYPHVIALVGSTKTETWKNDNVQPYIMDESTITSQEITNNLRKSSPKPLVESDPPLLESDPPLLESDPPLLDSDPPLFTMKNCNDNANLNLSYVPTSIALSADKIPNNEDEINLNQTKPRQAGRKSVSFFNFNSDKRVDFSSLKMDDRINEENVGVGKNVNFTAKESKNILAKKKRQPRAKAKRLPLKKQESSNDVDLPATDEKIQGRQTSKLEKHAIDDYELYAIPHDVSKSKVSGIVTATPEEKPVAEDSGFITMISDEKSTLMETTKSPKLQSKKRKFSIDDDIYENLTTVKERNSAVPREKKILDDNLSLFHSRTIPTSAALMYRDSSPTTDDFSEPKPSKIKKTNRKAAVSSMKKTKQILQPVKSAVETDSSSIIELQQVGSPTNEVYKTSNKTVKMNEDSDSDVSWLKGNTGPSFEIPRKTYKIWTQKNAKTPEAQETKNSKQNASVAIRNNDSYHWSNIDNFSLVFQDKKRKKLNTSLKNLETTDINVASKSKSKRESSVKSRAGPSNSRKGKKIVKPGSPLVSHHRGLKIAPKVLESDKNDPTGSDSSYLPHVLFSRDDVLPTNETVTTNAEQTYSEEDISQLPPLVEKAPSESSKLLEKSQTSSKKRIARSIQRKEMSTTYVEIDQEIPLNPLPEHTFSSPLPKNHFTDSDNESMKHDNLSSGFSSNSSCAGSDKEKESILNHDMDKISMNHMKKKEKRFHSRCISNIPDGRKPLLKRFLTDASSVSSVSRQKEKHKVDYLGKKASLSRKKGYNATGHSRKFDPTNENDTNETFDLTDQFLMDNEQASSSRHLQNTSHYHESSSTNSDSSFSLTSHSMLLPINYDDDQKLLKKFMYTAQMLTSNLYKALISIREDYLKVLSDFDGKSQLMSGNFSSMKEYQHMKNQYWLRMRNRLKQLLNALDLYRLKEKRFEEAFKLLRKRTGAAYVKARYQAAQGALHNYEEKLLHDLKKVMMKTSKKHDFFSHL